ncbi:nucleotidyltransferase substrate binding protein [Flavobacterium sp. 3HN19-14]|uniref:nucleotidyltransferase substrate binding protein n=1 Tax=Flavobacterium sp. 3HN19-14 TaxID=3448133 RepID=UPI003EDFDA56
MENDIRWEQRFSNFVKAVDKLSQSVKYIQKNFNYEESQDDKILDEMIKEGLIQRFEYTHELAWNVMKDYAEYQGNANIGGSRDATREAFQLKLITNGQIWMDMISSRNKTSHTYNEATANEIYDKILNDYYLSFIEFKNSMEDKRTGKQEDLF